jgi:membrane fusion protein (multidrug efflux system)
MRTALLLVALIACSKKGGEEAAKKELPAPVKVKLHTAAVAEAPKQLVLTGMVAANQRAEVTADGAGKVLAVKVERGDDVKFGDELLKLDVQTAALGAREVQANLASARAQRALAEEECKRTQQLFDKGAITKSEYDRQMTTCTAALQQVSALEARAAMMSKSIADGIVRAPFAGKIGQRMVSPGEWVAPGRPLFVLVDAKALKIELSVPEVAIKKVALGQRVQLRAVSDPDHVVGAKVTRLGAEIGRTRSLIVEATIDEGSTFVPGMFAEALLESGKIQRVVVPKTAIVKRCGGGGVGAGSAAGSAAKPKRTECAGGKPRVFVANKNHELEERIVQTGPTLETGLVAIIDGVEQGEKLVELVDDSIVDGLRVAE